MIIKPFEDLAPVALDFEDPDHMLAQQEMVEQEAIRRANQTSIQVPPEGNIAPDQTGVVPTQNGVQQASGQMPLDGGAVPAQFEANRADGTRYESPTLKR